jgi:predicted transcriptional regulator
MAIISKKKEIFPITKALRSYIKKYDREMDLPIYYGDLLRYDNSIPLYDKTGNDTLWETVFFPQGDMEHINASLKKVYAIMKSDGDLSVMDHLIIDRVDLCVYGNTQPFRVRVVNQINDNFDYFYIKNADASRIYGLELEHLLSPNKISYVVNRETLIEEHIVGIPAELFIKKYLGSANLNEIRLAKEFVKFNERCFVRLLGDMHSSNFVIDITPDFEDVEYRLRAIDFDQQSYEGRRAIYLPQYYTQNNPIIKIGLKHMTPETVKQYQREERSNIANRLKVEHKRIKDLLLAMKKDKLSKPENITRLRKELADFYEDKDFLKCECMGDLVEMSLEMLTRKPNLYKDY